MSKKLTHLIKKRGLEMKYTNIKLRHLPLKTKTTYAVEVQEENGNLFRWYFTPENGSVFESPYLRAKKLYDKLVEANN